MRPSQKKICYAIKLSVFLIVLYATQTGEDSTYNDPVILILGAGMAGVSAAKALVDRGFTNFKIIEGSSKVGGRMKCEKIGNHSVELGAMWIYGKGGNPVFKMAKKSGLSFIDDGRFNSASWSVKDENGNDISIDADDAFDRFENVIDELNAYSFENDDETVRKVLQRLNWNPTQSVDSMIEEYFLGFESGVLAENLSAKNLVIHAPYDAFQSHDMLAVNDSRGYQSVFDHLMESFNKNVHLHFNQKVTDIDQSDDTIFVHTKDGSVFRADYVIVTFSLGVFQDKIVEFSPELPKWKSSAIDKFGMCDYSHIYLQFPDVFWDDTSFLVFVSEDRIKDRFWFNMNHIHPGCNILQLSIYGKESRRLEELQDNEVVEELVNVLQQMYPNGQVPVPVDFKISGWWSDPLFRGAYSYWPAGFTSTDMNDLAAPVERVHFAGEHISHKQYGYVHSAHVSGTDVANALLDLIQKSDTRK